MCCRPRALLAAAVVASVGLVVWGVGPRRARAWCRMTTSTMQPTTTMPCVTDGIPLAWHRPCISIAVDQRGTPGLTMDQIRNVVTASFSAWESIATCPDGSHAQGPMIRLDTQPSFCSRAQYKTNGPNVNTIAFVDDWSNLGYDPSAYALTTVWHNVNTGEIYDADMQLNNALGPFAICDPTNGCTTGNPVPVDLQNVVTHEAGHFFGMAHSNVPEATMFSMAARGEVKKRTLESDDIAGFCNIYPAGSLTGACDYTPRGGEQLDCEHKGCGCSAPGAGTGGAGAGAVAAMVLLSFVLRRRRPGGR